MDYWIGGIATARKRPTTHFLGIRNATRNEAENVGFEGKFVDFEETMHLGCVMIPSNWYG